MENQKLKKTLGKRKVEIKKIEKPSHLQVTFSKRKRGLFKKASEIALLCGVEVAIVLQSPAKKIFAFGHPTVEALTDRLTFSSANPPMIAPGNNGRIKNDQAVAMLEMERMRMVEEEARGFWWEESIEGLELHQLEEFLCGLEGLQENINKKLNVLELLEGFEEGKLDGGDQNPAFLERFDAGKIVGDEQNSSFLDWSGAEQAVGSEQNSSYFEFFGAEQLGGGGDQNFAYSDWSGAHHVGGGEQNFAYSEWSAMENTFGDEESSTYLGNGLMNLW